jgi:RNA polymerase sigma-70 factor (ECF subfamily)
MNRPTNRPTSLPRDDPVMPDEFTELRPLLFSIAYRMLGSVSDAEDVVQDSYLRYRRALDDGTDIGSVKAFLSTVTTRLSIDHLRSARARRETYVGEWLPEPLLTVSDADPGQQVADTDSLSMAFLLVLERLAPVERAVFLLHDVFGYDYAEIGGMVGKSAANCRQIGVRARRHVADHRPRFESSREERDRLADRFVAALQGGDMAGLVELLAADVVVTGDSGGMISPSWPRPILGRDRVARLLAAVSEQLHAVSGARLDRVEVNGQPGAVVRDGAGHLVNVFSFDIAEGTVQAVRSVINPDKLRHLGPLANLSALRQRLSEARHGDQS